MDFVNGNIRKIYFRYLAAAFGSAMITSVYSIVDMAMVGLVISGALILLLPVAAGADSLWLARPITELVVSVYVALNIRKYTKALPEL